MPNRLSFPASHRKAGYVLYAVFVLGWTQTQAAISIGLNSGTVSHICRGKRFKGAVPIPFQA